MTGYTKLFNSILNSMIWREDPVTKVVWVTMLAMADQYGNVDASVPGLAHVAGVSVGEAEAALSKFLAPDPYSRTTDYEGRRIESIDGGWLLLNHWKYREKLSLEDKKQRAALRQQRYRDRKAVTQKRDTGITERHARNESRESRHPEASASPETETETEAEAREQEKTARACADDLFVKIGEIGYWKDGQSITAKRALVKELAGGADAAELLNSLVGIYEWTEWGKFFKA